MIAKTTPRNLFAGMNKTEAAFAQQLEARKRRGEISEWFYEGLTLKLGHDCRYTPDFLEIALDGMVTLHETKGFMREDALVKIRTAAKQYPFRFIVHRLNKGQWTSTDYTHER